MMKDIVRGTGPHLLVNTWHVDGDPTDVGDVTITIVDANGDSVVSDAATTNEGDGLYSYSLADQTNLNILRVSWQRNTGATLAPDYFEVVGNLLFTEEEARNTTITGDMTPLADTSSYTDAKIYRARKLIQHQFEDRTGRPWTRRYCRVESRQCGAVLNLLEATPQDSLGNRVGGPGWQYPVKLISATTNDGTDLDTDDIRIDGHLLCLTSGVWSDKSVVEYEYGPDPVPIEANEHALTMAIANLIPNDISAYAQTFQGQDGTVNYAGGLAWPATVWNWLKNTPRPPFAL